MDTVSGQVLTQSTLDMDGGVSSYVLTVLAQDSGGQSVSVDITVSLVDVNEFPPAFSSISYSTSISESVATSGASLVTVGDLTTPRNDLEIEESLES